MPLTLRLASILAGVAPPACWACAATPPAGEPLCRACRAGLRFLGPRIEPLAGVPLWAAVAYEGPARPLIHGLKYRGARGLAGPLAAQVAANAPRDLLAPFGIALVPVPGAPQRVRRRGYDQAALLALALSRRTGIPVVGCLARRTGASQVGRGRGARRQALANAIRVRSPPPAAALLVDDVATTGATLAACADMLRAGGCGSVRALTYARTPGR